MTVSQELRTGVRYIVTHPSKNGEFKAGDVIWLEEDGAIMNGTIKGWMAAEDVPEATEGMEVKSANPVAQELREWASEHIELWFSDLSSDSLIALREVGLANFLKMVRLDDSDRRTFALLVACALEDDD